MAIECITITSRAHWLELRKRDVTASVVAALFSAHPFMSPLKLFLTHRDVEFDDVDDRVKRRGRIMEGAVGNAVLEERPQWRLEANEVADAVPKHPRLYLRDNELKLGATVDFFIHGDPRGPGILQAKTAAPHIFERDWQGGEVVPFWIQLQALTEAMLWGASFAAVAALQIHAFDLACALHEIPRHAAAEKRIRDAVTQFWLDVEDGNEPDADYGRDAELLRAIAPREVAGKTVDLSGNNELPALLEQRAAIMEGIKGYEARKSEIETQVKFAMKDAESVVGLPDWKITWKSQHQSEYTVEAKDFRALRIFHKKDKGR
jgi:predicted phage-related endonuclease